MNLTGQDSVLDCLASYLNCQLPACVCYRQTFTLSCQSINKLMYTCAYRLELRKWSLEKTSSLHVLTAFENEAKHFLFPMIVGGDTFMVGPCPPRDLRLCIGGVEDSL